MNRVEGRNPRAEIREKAEARKPNLSSGGLPQLGIGFARAAEKQKGSWLFDAALYRQVTPKGVWFSAPRHLGLSRYRPSALGLPKKPLENHVSQACNQVKAKHLLWLLGDKRQ